MGSPTPLAATFHFAHPDWTFLEAGGARAWTRGWIDQGGAILDAAAMGRELAALALPPGEAALPALAARVQDWNGNFAFCLARNDEVLLGVDVVRTLPLLYSRRPGGLLVSDSHEWMRERAGRPELNEEGAEDYLVSGFVHGDATLRRGISSLQAGEILRIDRTGTSSRRHFSFNPDAFQDPDLRLDERTFRRLDDLLLSSLRRMLGSAREVNRWIVPLSGGYDSRIVASGLRRLGADNVLCLSYGRAGNGESALSRQVAEALGYEWRFAEYNRATWGRLMADPRIPDYLRYACNGNSLPVLQDFLALTQLKDSGVLQAGDVLVPGHTLDFLSGSHLDAVAVETRERSIRKASSRVVERHGAYWWDERGQEAVRRRVQLLVERESEEVRGRSAAAIIEWFDWQERQAKFIVNNVRAYEFLGYRWRLPLWDRELVSWWKTVPYEHRLGRKLLREAFRTTLATPETRQIPVHGVVRPVAGEASRSAPRPAGSPARAAARAVWRGSRWARAVLSSFRRRVPPPETETPMASEERFADQAGTVAELLGGPRCPLASWPRALRRHVRGRERWSVRQSGTGGNALFAAYVLKSQMQDP